MLALLGLIPITWRIGAFTAFAVAVIGVCTYERVKLIHEGEQEATQSITKANEEEARRAQAAQTTVDGCYATGGDWDRARGVCDHPAGK